MEGGQHYYRNQQINLLEKIERRYVLHQKDVEADTYLCVWN